MGSYDDRFHEETGCPVREEASASRPEAPKRRALLIGIDTYYNLPGKDLKGCQNDVCQIKRLLIEKFGFVEGDIDVLVNQAATQAAVRDAMARLLDRTQTDDLVFFQFAGHGSRMTDREGNKPSGLDETIVPYDSGRRPKPNRDITDDEISVWLMRLTEKTAHVVLLFDCCHSATAFRDGFGCDVRSIDPDTRSIEELPATPLDAGDLALLKKRPGLGLMSLPTDRYVALSACQDEERAHEYTLPAGEDALHHGALTFFLLRELTQANGRTTYRDLFEQISPVITARFPNQHPQLEGARDRVLFNLEQVPLAIPVYATWSGGSQVTLSAGAVHDVVAGSIWELHALEKKSVDSGPSMLARVEALQVTATQTQAELLTESVCLPQRLRAIEIERPFTRQWSVELVCDPQSLSGIALTEQIRCSPWLRIVGPAERARARIYLVPPRSVRCDPAPQVPFLSTPSWLVVGEDGELIMPPIAGGRADLIRSNLERCVRYRQALELDNPLSRYAGQVELMLLRQATDGRWERDIREVSEAQRFAIEVRSSYPDPVYVVLLAFNMDQSIGPIYPPPGSVQRLFPNGKPLLLGYEADRALTASFPRDTMLVPRIGMETTASGTDYIKLFVTASPVDFSPLWQSALSTRIFEFGANRLASLLALYSGASAEATRCINVAAPASNADWDSRTCELVVKRRVEAVLPR